MKTDCIKKLCTIVSNVLEMEPLKLSPDQSMTEFDIDSMSIFEILGELKQYYPDLPFTLLLEKQTLNEVGDYLCSNFPVETKKFLENEII